jgi:hypothetical protein
MKIPCVSCQFMCKLENNLVNPTGSLVRCSKCDFIFMVHRPSFAEEPIAKDTNIDQSILYDLYITRPELKAELPVDEISEETDDYVVKSLISIEDFGGEALKEPDSNTEDFRLAELPDISEYENVIDWGDTANSEEPSAAKQQNNKSTENSKLNKI